MDTDKIQLNVEQKKMLKTIMGDPYSSGAFAGMITNIYFARLDLFEGMPTISQKEDLFTDVVKTALTVRIELLKLSGTWVPPVEAKQ